MAAGSTRLLRPGFGAPGGVGRGANVDWDRCRGAACVGERARESLGRGGRHRRVVSMDLVGVGEEAGHPRRATGDRLGSVHSMGQLSS